MKSSPRRELISPGQFVCFRKDEHQAREAKTALSIFCETFAVQEIINELIGIIFNEQINVLLFR